MTRIPLEDNFTDIIGKAQRGFRLADEDLARRAGVTVEELGRVQSGEVDEGVLRKLARGLNLGRTTLVESARGLWYPPPQEIGGLSQFNTAYHDLAVNAYLVWDPTTKAAAVFDTGATCDGLLRLVQANHLTVKQILLTHTHPDHIADLEPLRQATGAPVYVGQLEAMSGAEAIDEGREFRLGNLRIEARLTTGHSRGGITYVISGLARPVAVVGDAIFAGSMGGGLVSYLDALANNRKRILVLPDETILCPGHGPLTSVGEEKRHNPFFPEFQTS
jgi:hydroxyacylglutathione hydrolase